MKTIKSVISVSLTLIMIFGLFAIVSFESSAADSYTKVTSAPLDWSGDYLIVCENNSVAFNGGLGTLDASGNNISVTINDGAIASDTATDAAKFTIAKSGNDYTIKSASGYYIGNTSNSNTLASNADTAYTNSISLNNGDVNIVSSGGAYLRYNPSSGQTRFRYYKSSSYTSQLAVQLYKLNSSGGDTPATAAPATEAPATAAPATSAPATEAAVSGVTDVLTASDFAATETKYKEFSDVKKNTAIYAGQSAYNNGNIQIKSNDSNTGIVSTTSGGKVKSVKINIASGSNTVNVYGSNTAYTSASDLFNNNKKGTLLGSVSSTGTISVSGDYAYVGIRSNSGAIYLSSVEITWDDGNSAQGTTAPTSSVAGETVVDTLNADFTGKPSSYTEWSGKTGASNAVYSGQSSGGSAYIQIRAQSPSGIVTTASYGRITKIEVAWDHVQNSSNRTLDIYGDNTAYKSSSELYGASPKGTYLDSMVFDNTTVALVDDYITELEINGDYKYIGIRSRSGAAYLKSIKITWDVTETPTEPATQEPTEAPTETPTEAPTEAPTEMVLNTYTVRWLDYDGTELASKQYTEGETPVYPNADPGIYYDDTYRYTFTGWSPSIVPVSGNTDYTAQYASQPLTYYTVTWNNYDGNELDSREYPEGKTPKYYGERPSKPDDGDYRYVFSGWSPALEALTDHDVTYTAQFTQVEKTSSILKMDTDVVSKMENSYYMYDGELLVLGETGGFWIDGDKLMLGDSVVADIEEDNTQRLGNTVYVKGIGTSDKPYEFYPNYIYGKTVGDISGYQNNADIDDYNPGDGFIGYSRIKVGNSLVSFMADSSVSTTTANGYIGVGMDNYGYKYENKSAVAHSGYGPYEFDNDEHILYYSGVNDSNAFVFTTSALEYIAEYYRRIPEKEADIFEKGNIEYFLDDYDNIYSYSSGEFDQITEEETETTELINLKITPDGVKDVIFTANLPLENQYYGGRLLGFQKKLTNLSNESERNDSLRFMTVLSSKILKKLYENPNSDFGYVFAAVEGDDVDVPIDKVKIDNPKLNKHSCKNTENSLTGSFGDKNFSSTDYKYITAGVDEIPTGYTLAVRFYITYKGETHYINYPARDKTGIVFNSSDYVS